MKTVVVDGVVHEIVTDRVFEARLEERIELQRQREKARKCRHCGAPREPSASFSPGSRCERCLEAHAESARRSREKARAAGMCIQCMKAPPVKGRVRCRRCAARHNAITNRLGRRDYRRLRAGGICTTCRRRPAKRGASRCMQCALANAAASTRRATARVEAGVCVYGCGREPQGGRQSCDACYAKKKASKAKYEARLQGSAAASGRRR